MIARDDLFMVASVNHAWATCKKLTVEDLTAGKWVLREDGSGTRAAFVKAVGALGVPHGNLNIAIELPSKEAVLAAVLAGAGSRAGALKRLPVSLAPRAFYGIQHADRYRSRAVSAFLEILRTHAAL
jgi:DNA-binding transcriptional LysR family regulator